MFKKPFFASSIVLFSLIAIAPSVAQEAPSPNMDADTKADNVNAGLEDIDINSFKLSVTNAIINFAKNSGKAILDLQWSYLPKDKTLATAAGEYGVIEPITITITNSSLEEKTWIEDVNHQLKQQEAENVLTDALHISSLEELLTDEPGADKFYDYWVSNDGIGKEVASTSITSTDYYGLRRDYNAMRFLLQSDGNYISLDIDDDKAKDDKLPIEFPIILDDGIDWKIKIYKFVVQEANIDENLEEVAFYRYTIEEEIEPVTLYFRNYAENQKLVLNTGATHLKLV